MKPVFSNTLPPDGQTGTSSGNSGSGGTSFGNGGSSGGSNGSGSNNGGGSAASVHTTVFAPMAIAVLFVLGMLI